VLHVIDQLRRSHDLANCTVGLLGMAFKPEIDDVRASLSYKLKHGLLMHTRRVLTTDPLVKNDPDLLPLEAVVAQSDILVLCTPHKIYKNLATGGKPVFDVWNFIEPAHAE
jgi:UDP-N-acetyl-D-mannosaminuronic acid dehydrogenase